MAKHNIAAILQTINKGATFAGIDLVTQVKVNKTIPNDAWVEGSTEPKRVANPHFDRISKMNVGSSVIIGASYENMVRKHLAEQQIEEQNLAADLEAEGKVNAAKAILENQADPNDFVVGERKWGTRIPGTPMIEHKGDYYIDMIYRKAGESSFRNGGKLIDESELLGYTKSAPKPEAQGGVDKKVVFRTTKLDSIVAIRIGGKEYVGSFYYDPEEI